jgi:hypothetical protein
MTKFHVLVNSRGAKRQTIVELEQRILEIRRLATHHHLSIDEWSAVDRLRRRLSKMQREVM